MDLEQGSRRALARYRQQAAAARLILKGVVPFSLYNQHLHNQYLAALRDLNRLRGT